MTQSESSDSGEILELLRNASGGDQQALAAALDRYRDRLHRLVDVRLDRRLRGRFDASDVVQETFLEASKRLAEYLKDPKVPFFLWLRMLTCQKVLEIHRREFAQKRGGGREAAPSPADFSASTSGIIANQFVDSGTSPSHGAARDEMRGRLEGALEQLDPGDREVLVLRHYENLSNVEAAHVLGINEGTAAQRHFRALKRLKEILEAIPGLKSFVWRP